MLIKSDRIRHSDWPQWFADEEYDCLLAQIKRPQLEAKARRSMQIIREFLSEPAFVSMSWGKDSVLVAWLTWRVCHESGIPMPPIAYSRVDGDRKANPDCDLVRDYFLATWESPYIEQRFNTCDHPGADRNLHFKLLESLAGTSRRITGIRNTESRRRSVRFQTQGFSTKHTCAPLSLWTTEDVFLYSFIHDLPLHPAYAMNGGGAWKRCDLRVHSIGGLAGCEFSRRSWEALYYPELINELYPGQGRTA